jgi:hypothetical protein
VGIGIGSAIFACLLTLVYNTFYSSNSKYVQKRN